LISFNDQHPVDLSEQKCSLVFYEGSIVATEAANSRWHFPVARISTHFTDGRMTLSRQCE
jgi:hypothetical protein